MVREILFRLGICIREWYLGFGLDIGIWDWGRDAYFTLCLDIHPGKVIPFYSVYLTNWEMLPNFGHFYQGRVYNFLENIYTWIGDWESGLYIYLDPFLGKYFLAAHLYK